MAALLLVPLLVCLGLVDSASAALEIDVRPVGRSEAADRALLNEVMRSSIVEKALRDTRHRVLDVRHEPTAFLVDVYDYTNDRALRFRHDGALVSVEPSSVLDPDTPPLPTDEEFDDAVAILERDPSLGPSLRDRRLIPYHAMPLLLEPSETEGRRVIPVGLRPTREDVPHEIVAVDLSRERVKRFDRRSPPDSIATAHTCGPLDSGQKVTKIGTRGSAQIIVRKNGVEIWRMFATRPAASSGYWGSGIDLREISYRGRRVLHRAHIPVLSVDYDENACGPFRDVVNHESAFAAEGTKVADGFLRVTKIPETIFETKIDLGNFWGVAIFEDGDQLVLATELAAAWYRYANEYRFGMDGTIRPIFKFDAVHNSCTCRAHDHHVYWRFDFDLDGPDNSLHVLANGQWSPVAKEAKFTRGPATAQAWRVSNPTRGTAYEIRPGPHDGTANRFGSGDAWVLHYRGGEIDDSRLGKSKDVKLDRFVTGESVQSKDLVFWYGGHVRHAPDGNELPHFAGPVLSPVPR